MYQFFVDFAQIDIANKRVTITGADVNHIKNVLRMRVGEEIDVRDGVNPTEYRCIIAALRDDAVECELAFVKEDGVELPVRAILFQGLPKSDKMELIIQKAVELGVSEIVPVATARSVMKIDPKKEKNKIERYNAIAMAAAKQSKRSVIPTVTGVMSMKEALAYAGDCNVRLIPYELAEGMKYTREMMSQIKPGDSVAIFIGPEGGFAENEIAAAEAAGVKAITLGKRILRTETAGMTVLSWLVYLMEED